MARKTTRSNARKDMLANQIADLKQRKASAIGKIANQFYDDKINQKENELIAECLKQRNRYKKSS